MDSVIIVVGVVSGILSIIGFFFPAKSLGARWLHAVYILVVAIIVSIATYQWSELKRRNDVATAAEQLVADRGTKYTHRGYVFAALAFLEKNRDLLPETYARAVSACTVFKCDDPNSSVDMVELSFTFDGIVKGIAAVSK